jgi:hypothetical protein
MTSSVSESDYSGFFLWGHLNELSVPPMTIAHIKARVEEAVTAADNNMLSRAQ